MIHGCYGPFVQMQTRSIATSESSQNGHQDTGCSPIHDLFRGKIMHTATIHSEAAGETWAFFVLNGHESYARYFPSPDAAAQSQSLCLVARSRCPAQADSCHPITLHQKSGKMGNNASKLAEASARIVPREVLDQDLADDMSDMASAPDDWSHDGYDRVIDSAMGFETHEDTTQDQQHVQVREHNNSIARAFSNELTWVMIHRRNLLSAWLAASKIYRDTFASRRPITFEDTADVIEDSWRQAVKRASGLATEYVADVYYKLKNPRYITKRLVRQGIPLQFIPIFTEFLRKGFDYQGLLLAIKSQVDKVDGDLEKAIPNFRNHYRSRYLDAEGAEDQLIAHVPVLLWIEFDLEYRDKIREPYPQPSSRLYSPESGSFKNLSSAQIAAQASAGRDGQLSPEEDFIRLSMFSPTRWALSDTPVSDNDKIIQAFCKDFRWLAKRQWPPQASWRFISSLVRNRIHPSDRDVDKAIAKVKGKVRTYKDSREVGRELRSWRIRATEQELVPTLQELPNAELRTRLQQVVSSAIARDQDYHRVVRVWHLDYKQGWLLRRNSFSSSSRIREYIEAFHEWLSDEANIRDLLPTKLFDCLGKDSDDDDDDDDDDPDSRHPAFEGLINGLHDGSDSEQDHFDAESDDSDLEKEDEEGGETDGSERISFEDGAAITGSATLTASGERSNIQTQYGEGEDRYSPRLHTDQDVEDEVHAEIARLPPIPSQQHHASLSPLSSLWHDLNTSQPLEPRRPSASNHDTSRGSPNNASARARDSSPTLPSAPRRSPNSRRDRTPRLSTNARRPSAPRGLEAPPFSGGFPASPNYGPTPTTPIRSPNFPITSPALSHHTTSAHPENTSTQANHRSLSLPPIVPSIPTTPRLADIQGPTSPSFTQTFDALVRGMPSANRRRNQTRYRDRPVPRVDPLRKPLTSSPKRPLSNASIPSVSDMWKTVEGSKPKRQKQQKQDPFFFFSFFSPGPNDNSRRNNHENPLRPREENATSSEKEDDEENEKSFFFLAACDFIITTLSNTPEESPDAV
ncbi:hypothetical protein CERZMDRAFT_83878 [Cercospora zeae-maydis SCOH1-5]|uniref:Uncharacterized protein n=1 Tax=Cercospora zeae-maydis SCOH1-5 TaxID=717836 RepID=A0A6A6FKN2_9PEZI|nr:hypothetical protein CERZMDRAFT_83878 [Cercospora zeae-maydis SCOH1-5]